MRLIVHDGQDRDISNQLAIELEEEGVIGFCENCECYHLCEGYTWADLERSAA